MRKYNFSFPVLIHRFEKHDLIRNELLKLINEQDHDELIGGGDNITGLDWIRSKDNNRTWVKLIREDLEQHLREMVSTLGCSSICINELWYQQYSNQGTHGWHKHGSNYTGVYYVDLTDDCARTRLSNSSNPHIHTDVIAQEGDILIFPSTLTHRALVQSIDYTKTIISFNFDFDSFTKEYMTTIDNSVGVDFETFREVREIYRK